MPSNAEYHRLIFMHFDDYCLGECSADIKFSVQLALIVSASRLWRIVIRPILAVVKTVLFLSSRKEVTQTLQTLKEISHAQLSQLW